MRHVIAQNLILDAAQCRTDRRDQRYDVDAVAVFLDHPRDAAHLALDPIKTLHAGCLAVFLHDCYIPPVGIICKPREDNRNGCATSSSYSRKKEPWLASTWIGA